MDYLYVITDLIDSNTWVSIQNQLDAGNVEVASHSGLILTHLTIT